jgi:CubicO group peptidase (beta-lactamase class C family)
MVIRMRAVLCACLASCSAFASSVYPPARFTDPQRASKLAAAFPAIDRLFVKYAADRKIPGLVWGIVIDGKLAHFGQTGVRQLGSKEPVTRQTIFRIASMTKSFTALAVLKLRDEGKLQLDDPLSKWIPEFGRMELPTRDSAPLTIRHLLTHGAGWPEDNPWGDQQLGATPEQLADWLKRGIPFSTPPDTRYEYSNYGFGLLGRIVAKASGMPYEQYLRTQILEQLAMGDTTLEPAKAPVARRAVGYRLKPDNTYAEEPPLPHGEFGAMGGLLTSSEDLAKYVAFQLSAWPPRDDAEAGPVRRSSVREMNHMWRVSNLRVTKRQGTVSGYGYGLRIATSCRFAHVAAHGGGLPGFGSYMAWLPEHGVGMFAMTNLTYAGPAQPIDDAWDEMLKTGALQPRELPVSPVLSKMREQLWLLWKGWDSTRAKAIAAVNLFLDIPEQQRRDTIERLKREVGACRSAGAVIPENWLRGQFNLSCERGQIGVFFTLAPTQPPLLQHVEFRKINADRMIAPTGAPAGVSCQE